MTKRVVMLSGFKNAGKDTTATLLATCIINSYRKRHPSELLSIEYKSFALPIKQASSVIFGIPFEILEGKTPENRELRETVDEFWSGYIPDFTPRQSLTMLGTDILRKYIHDDLWVLRMQQEILTSNANTIIITDLREPNEEEKIEQLCNNNNITVMHINIQRTNPEWYDEGVSILQTKLPEQWDDEFEKINVHPSEWKQLLLTPDYVIDNTDVDYESNITQQLNDIDFKI